MEWKETLAANTINRILSHLSLASSLLYGVHVSISSMQNSEDGGQDVAVT